MLYLIFESVEGRPELRARLQQLYRGIREMYETGLRGVVPDAAQRRRLAVISVAALDGIFLQWLLDPEAIDLEALHDELRALREARGAGAAGAAAGPPNERSTNRWLKPRSSDTRSTSTSPASARWCAIRRRTRSSCSSTASASTPAWSA